MIANEYIFLNMNTSFQYKISMGNDELVEVKEN